MLSAGDRPTTPFHLDRIYTLLYTGCPPSNHIEPLGLLPIDVAQYFSVFYPSLLAFPLPSGTLYCEAGNCFLFPPLRVAAGKPVGKTS